MTRINSDNLFGISPYIVDPLASQGSFTTIQSAMDALDAAGGNGFIYVRPGTYNENLTIYPRQVLQAASDDGRVMAGNTVIVQGSHTFSSAGVPGGVGATEFQGFVFSDAGDLFNMTTTGPDPIVLLIKESFLISSGGNGVNVNNVGGSAAICGILDCQVIVFGTALEVNGDNCQGQMGSTVVQQSNNGALVSGNSANLRLRECNIAASNSSIVIGGAGSTANLEYCIFNSTQSCVDFAFAGTVNAYFCSYFTNVGSGEYISAPVGGTYNYISDGIKGSARTISPNLTVTADFWRPTSETGVSATTTGRGVSSFSSADFTSTDGFIELNGSFTTNFIDQNANFLANANEGYYCIGGGSVTATTVALPSQGDVLKVVRVGATTTIVQAQVGQFIQIGSNISSNGGTATATADGDFLTLVFRSASNIWYAESSVGSWTLA